MLCRVCTSQTYEFPLFALQPHGEEEDSEEERGEGDALPAQGWRRRAGARRASLQQEGRNSMLSVCLESCCISTTLACCYGILPEHVPSTKKSETHKKHHHSALQSTCVLCMLVCVGVC